MITARLALDYNRDVLAVPGSIFAINSQGSNRLIRQGATPVTGSDDILEALGLARAGEQLALNLDDCTPLERQVIELLQIEALPRDEIIMRLELSASEANSLLGVMEIKGLIKEQLGEMSLA